MDISNTYDLIIVGAGPAGITAAIYAARKGMKLLVIAKDIGGQMALSWDIENYTGYQLISGFDLSVKFREHMQRYNIEVKEDEEVIELKKEDILVVRTTEGEYHAKTAIVASGGKSRELGVSGEEEFKNKGLTYCATCDGPLFAGKDVVVVGGGNSGLDAALQLIKIVKHLYLIDIAPELTGDKVTQAKIKASGKISVFTNTEVLAIEGGKTLSAIRIKNKVKNTEEKLAVRGVFVEIGLIPNSGFIKSVEKNDLGEIKINSFNETNVSGIFAAGDVTDVTEKQIVIAAGEGAKAALSVFRCLARQT